MKHLLTFILMTSFTLGCSAQELNWHKIISADGNDFGIAIANDSENNVYSVGFYRDSELTIDGVTLPFAENMDSYLAKFSENGNLLWSIPFYGTGLFDRAEDVHVDEEDNVYVLCLMQDMFKIGDQETIVIPSENTVDFILMKFSSEGDLLFYKTYGGPANDIAYGFTFEEDEILLTGFITGEFYAGSDTLTTNGGADMLLMSVDNSGELNWMRSFGGEASDRLYKAQKNEDGNIIVCGYSAREFQFGETNLAANVAQYGGFIGLLDDQGTPIRAQQILPSESLASFDYLTVIGNEVYTLSNLRDSSLIDGSYYGQHDYNTFIISKLNSALDFEWIKEIPSANDTSYLYSFFITNYQSQPWIAGFYKGEIDLDGTILSSNIDTGLLISLDAEGQIIRQITIESEAALTASGLNFSASSLSVTCSLTGTGMLGGESFQTRNTDIILLNYNLDFLTSTETPTVYPFFNLYPNPVQHTLFITGEPHDFKSIAIYNSMGILMRETLLKDEINVDDLAKGVYYIKMRKDKQEVVRVFVKE